jgi:uncharacterized protein YukE
MSTPKIEKSLSNRTEEIIGEFIGLTKGLEQRLAKMNSKYTGLLTNNCEEIKKEENPQGYFPRLIRALQSLGNNLESIKQQVDELDKM